MLFSKNANNKGADQSAQMRRLICVFVVRKFPKTGFLASRPIYAEPIIRELFHLRYFFILHIKDIESKSIFGVTSTYHVQCVIQMLCL